MSKSELRIHAATEADKMGVYQVARLNSEIGEDGAYSLAPADEKSFRSEAAAITHADKLALKTGKPHAVLRVVRVRRPKTVIDDLS